MRVRPSKRRLASRRATERAGFTLLELMLVLAIIVVLGGVAILNFGGAQDKAYTNTTKATLQQLKSAITQYRIRATQLPESLESLVSGPSDPAKKASFGDGIIEAVPKDAWENDINYSLNSGKYELRSGGPDGQMNSDDDVVVTG